MRKALVGFLAVALSSATTNWAGGHHVIYRFIFPKDYIGWVRIDFGVKDAQELNVEDIRTGTKANIIVPNNGIVETSTTQVHSTWESYELYYRDEDRLVPIPKALYSSKWLLGGFGGSLRDDLGNSKAACWYFLIGPKSLRAKYPTEAYLRQNAELPHPGPISSDKTP